MDIRLKPVSAQTIVITGASSGIGLSTARMAAKQGAAVVLAARNEAVLGDLEREILGRGGRAIHVVADVGRREDVQAIHDAALKAFGGYDTWVNDAGVDIWGRLDQVDDADSKRLFDTNFWGMVYGSLIATAHLKVRGGALVNVGSVASDRAFPLQGMYCASKHALKAFTDTLRMELAEEGAPVSVTLVKPSSIGTPLAQQAKNYMDKEPMLPSPLYAPEEVAYAILAAAATPHRDIYVGGSGRAIVALGNLAPRLSDQLGETRLIKAQQRDATARPRRDNLHGPGPGGQTRSDPDGRWIRPSLSTRAMLNPVISGSVLAALGIVAGVLIGTMRPRTIEYDD